MTYQYTFELKDWKGKITKEIKSFAQKLNGRELWKETSSFIDRKDVKFVTAKKLDIFDENSKLVETVKNLNKYD